jgi:Methyltransferase domain
VRYRPVTAWPAVAEVRKFGPESSYLAFHAPRYAYLLDVISHRAPTPERVLDIGRSVLTEILHARLGVPVDTLGLRADRDAPTGRQFQFDLNQCQDRLKWRRDLPTYDLVVMAEVIEHLYTSPSLVLPFVRSLMNPRAILVVQTPNAAAFSVRMKLLLGHNPYHRISEDAANPMHFREYTEKELWDYAEGAGFEVLESQMRSYFDQRFAPHSKPLWLGTVENWAYDFMPRHFRTGMTMVLGNTSAPDQGSAATGE